MTNVTRMLRVAAAAAGRSTDGPVTRQIMIRGRLGEPGLH